jgi:hypothetical protein
VGRWAGCDVLYGRWDSGTSDQRREREREDERTRPSRRKDIQVNTPSRALPTDQLFPSLMALVDDLGRVGFILRLAVEGEDVGGLAVGDFVDSTAPGENTVMTSTRIGYTEHTYVNQFSVALMNPGIFFSTSPMSFS